MMLGRNLAPAIKLDRDVTHRVSLPYPPLFVFHSFLSFGDRFPRRALLFCYSSWYSLGAKEIQDFEYEWPRFCRLLAKILAFDILLSSRYLATGECIVMRVMHGNHFESSHLFENFMLTFLAFFNLTRREGYIERIHWNFNVIQIRACFTEKENPNVTHIIQPCDRKTQLARRSESVLKIRWRNSLIRNRWLRRIVKETERERNGWTEGWKREEESRRMRDGEQV